MLAQEHKYTELANMLMTAGAVVTAKDMLWIEKTWRRQEEAAQAEQDKMHGDCDCVCTCES
jgi:hypothetical protein